MFPVVHLKRIFITIKNNALQTFAKDYQFAQSTKYCSKYRIFSKNVLGKCLELFVNI